MRRWFSEWLPALGVLAVYVMVGYVALAFAVNGGGYLLGIGDQRPVHIDQRTTFYGIMRQNGESSVEELPLAYGHYFDASGARHETTLFGGDLKAGMTVEARESLMPLLPDNHRTSQAVAQLIMGLLALAGVIWLPFLHRSGGNP